MAAVRGSWRRAGPPAQDSLPQATPAKAHGEEFLPASHLQGGGQAVPLADSAFPVTGLNSVHLSLDTKLLCDLFVFHALQKLS